MGIQEEPLLLAKAENSVFLFRSFHLFYHLKRPSQAMYSSSSSVLSQSTKEGCWLHKLVWWELLHVTRTALRRWFFHWIELFFSFSWQPESFYWTPLKKKMLIFLLLGGYDLVTSDYWSVSDNSVESSIRIWSWSLMGFNSFITEFECEPIVKLRFGKGQAWASTAMKWYFQGWIWTYLFLAASVKGAWCAITSCLILQGFQESGRRVQGRRGHLEIPK